MSNQQTKAAPAARFTHYVSLHNGGIYPAMTSPAGYEDDHLNDFRPATKAEIEAYKNGAESIAPQAAELAPESLSEATPSVASPSVIQLQPDDPAPAPAPAIPPPVETNSLYDGVVAIPLE